MKSILITTVVGTVFLAGGIMHPAKGAVVYPGGVGTIFGPGTVNFTPNQPVANCPPGLGGFTVLSIPNNNDYKPGDNGYPENCNQVGLTVTFTAAGSIDIPLKVVYYIDANGVVQPGTTEYLFKQKTFNNTGLDLNQFNFELGFGTGSSFVASNKLDGLDFDVINANQIPAAGWGAWEISDNNFPNQEKTPTPISVVNASPNGTDLTPVFQTLDHQANSNNWTKGIVAKNSRFDFNYSIDIPDLGPLNLNQIPTGYQTIDPRNNTKIGYTFTLRLTPVALPSTPNTPLLPTPDPTNSNGFTFPGISIVPGALGTGNQPIFFDPMVATGYDYSVTGGPLFASVLIPYPLPKGDSNFILELPGFPNQNLVAGTTFNLLSFNPSGFSNFRITGIDAAEMLDPTNPVAFVTGATFIGTGTITYKQNPIGVNIPEPSNLFGLGLLGFGAFLTRQLKKNKPAQKDLEDK